MVNSQVPINTPIQRYSFVFLCDAFAHFAYFAVNLFSPLRYKTLNYNDNPQIVLGNAPILCYTTLTSQPFSLNQTTHP